MATTPSIFNCFRTSSPTMRVEPGTVGTTVTPHRLIPMRQSTARVTPISMPKEPEDALLTGGTRSLDRRLLALNLSGSLPIPAGSAAPERIAPPLRSAVA
jgi:hypothetical protein